MQIDIVDATGGTPAQRQTTSAWDGNVGLKGTPNGAAPVLAKANGAATTIVATMPAVAGKTNYLAGLTITGLGATAAAQVTATLAGLLGGNLFFGVAIPANPAGLTPQNFVFNPPLPASAVNIAVTFTLPNFGAGNTEVDVILTGYVL